jgi:acid phosphatase
LGKKFFMRGAVITVAVAAVLSSCDKDTTTTQVLQEKVDTIVVIYAENRSFDNLYGLFPGANGIPGVNVNSSGKLIDQADRDVAGTTLISLPQTWGGVTAAGQTPVVTQAQSAGLPNRPFPIETSFGVTLPQSVVTRDLYHRFYENQMQIDGGKNDKFAGYADSGGLVMGYYDGSEMALWNIARQYVLADNFFMGAFGGSFLNHQYLICACAPEYPNADTAVAHPTIAALDTDSTGAFLPRLTLAANSPATALDGPPTFVNSGNITPKNYFGDGTFRAVNTMQPPYQPAANAPDPADTTHLYTNPATATTLPPQTQQNIGDLLTAKKVSWRWYAGAWDQSLAIATGNRAFPAAPPGAAPNFQFHHQPFNYFANLDPVKNAADRKEHLKDYNDLITDAQNGTLPSVVFYKPEGDLNQHPGYAAVKAGDDHIAQLIGALQKSPQWSKMVVVVTYDENGGFWDHVTPPKGDQIGPGTRIPAIIVSPVARRNFVDHTQYDTASVLRLITRRFGLPTLAGLTARDAQLKKNNQPTMGDLTNALQLLP